MAATLVLDIGKTNVKSLVVSKVGTILDVRRSANASLDRPPYLQLDIERVWNWFLDAAAEFAQRHHIDAITITTHGCAAVLVDETGPVLPPMDYECNPPPGIAAKFATVTPPFATTHTPPLPQCMNLGRQLFWQQRAFPEEFSRARWILCYPQYWAWRLSGMAASEVTSVGCHSHLWEPANHRVSNLVEEMGWESLLPPFKAAFDSLGPIRADLAARTGLPADCQVFAGIHDSNSAYSLYLRGHGKPFSLVSTGTWVVMFSPRMDLADLNPERDTMAMTNLRGEPLPTARFMGGREFGVLTVGIADKGCSATDLESVIEKRSFAMPSHAEGGGPFTGHKGSLAGPELTEPGEIVARATLYCALMTQTSMAMLHSDGDLIIDGGFVNNSHYCRLLASLLGHERCHANHDTEGTAVGAAMLACWNDDAVESPLQLTPVEGFRHPGLVDYASDWRQLVSR